jgi:hypothetical protein
MNKSLTLLLVAGAVVLAPARVHDQAAYRQIVGNETRILEKQ